MPEIIKMKPTRFACTIALLAVLCLPFTGITQSARKIEKKANASFANHDYATAAKLYAAILYDSPLVTKEPGLVYPFQAKNANHTKKIKESKRPAAQYKLAESYRLIYHYKDALPQYEQYIASKDNQFPSARLWYASCLLANDQPEKAIESFNIYLQKNKKTDSLTQIAKQGISNANFRISTKSVPPQAVVAKVKTTVSSDGSNFAMEKSSIDSFRFTSSRHEIDKKDEKFYPVRLYTGKINGTTVEKVNAVDADGMNMGTSSLSNDQLTLYFTGWKEEKKSAPVYYRIFYATRPSPFSKWNKPIALPAPVNVQGFNSKQPYISRDNRHLFFASDRTGGYGKYDLWMINLDGGSITGSAVNLGDHVNTVGEEASPFYDADSAYLYYSSNGKTGMGGMDIYRIHGDPKANEWTGSAINLGSPLNSVKDDLYYTRERNTDTAYLSSDRASNCCLEIFKAIDIRYKDTLTNTVKNIPSVEKTVVPLKIKEDTTNHQHLLDSIKAVTVKRMQVNFDFASSAVRKADYAQLNRIVDMLRKDPALNILIASFTDCIGTQERNIRLARKRSESVKQYLLSKQIESSRLNIDFFGKQHFLLPCIEDKTYNRKEQIANRRSDIIITTDKHPKWTPSGKEINYQPSKEGTGKAAETETISVPVREIATNKQPVGKGLDVSKKQNSAEPGKTEIAKTDLAKTKSPASGGTTPATSEKSKAGTVNQPLPNQPVSSAKPSNDLAAEKRVSSYRNVEKTKSNTQTAKEKEIAANKPKPNNTLANSSKKQKPVRNTVTEPVVTKAVPQTITSSGTGATKVDSMRTMTSITSLVDPLPRLKNRGIIEQMTSRTPRKSLEVFSTSDSVRIDLYDNGVFDYDSVSVIYNKELVKFKEVLQTNKPVTFYVKLDTDPKKNEMIFFAENLGLTPPNSALMVITDGDKKRTEVNVTSDLLHNSVIYFIKVKK
jgi:outer membrane protein OmpA-like peptidoglycan-associated protein